MQVENPSPNVTYVYMQDAARTVILFSYGTPVAYRSLNGAAKTAKRWSNTTSRHVAAFFKMYAGPVETISQDEMDAKVQS